MKTFVLAVIKKSKRLTLLYLALCFNLFLTHYSTANVDDGMYWSFNFGGDYLSGTGQNPNYFFPIPKIIRNQVTNDFGDVSLDNALDQYNKNITDLKYGYKASLTLGYSHIFWGLRPEIEVSLFTNMGLYNKSSTCGLRLTEIIDTDPTKDVTYVDEAICQSKARNVAYGMVNFILDIPIGKHLSSLFAIPPSSPYIGVGFGMGTCNQSNTQALGFNLAEDEAKAEAFIQSILDSGGTVDPADSDFDKELQKFLYQGTFGGPLNAPINCKGPAVQMILGFRQHWDTYFSSILDFRYTKIRDLGLFSMNVGFIQTFD